MKKQTSFFVLRKPDKVQQLSILLMEVAENTKNKNMCYLDKYKGIWALQNK